MERRMKSRGETGQGASRAAHLCHQSRAGAGAAGSGASAGPVALQSTLCVVATPWAVPGWWRRAFSAGGRKGLQGPVAKGGGECSFQRQLLGIIHGLRWARFIRIISTPEWKKQVLQAATMGVGWGGQGVLGYLDVSLGQGQSSL